MALQVYDKLSVSKEEALAYIEDISKLGQLADKSRPNIVVAVNKLQRRVSAPRQEDIDALKQLIRYLKGTKNLGILLGRNRSVNGNSVNGDSGLVKNDLIGYIDISY